MSKFYIGLYLIVTLSFLSLSKCSLFTKLEDAPFPFFFNPLIAGIIFSAFIVACLWKNMNVPQAILVFFLSNITYIGAIVGSIFSWSLAVPFIGGFGAFLVVFTLRYFLKINASNQNFIGYGMAMTLPGWILVFFLGRFNLEGIGFGVMVGLWQLAIGIMMLRVMDPKERKPKTNFESELEEYLLDQTIK